MTCEKVKDIIKEFVKRLEKQCFYRKKDQKWGDLCLIADSLLGGFEKYIQWQFYLAFKDKYSPVCYDRNWKEIKYNGELVRDIGFEYVIGGRKKKERVDIFIAEESFLEQYFKPINGSYIIEDKNIEKVRNAFREYNNWHYFELKIDSYNLSYKRKNTPLPGMWNQDICRILDKEKNEKYKSEYKAKSRTSLCFLIFWDKKNNITRERVKEKIDDFKNYIEKKGLHFYSYNLLDLNKPDYDKYYLLGAINIL